MTFAAMTAKRIGKCRICRGPYVKRSMTHIACSVPCSQEAARLKREKEAAKQAKSERQADKVRKEKLKTRKDFKAPAQVAANAYVRERDADLPCISCGKPAGTSEALTGGGWDAGHYRSVGSSEHLRYDLRNIHKQCKRCNSSAKGLAGNHVEFRKGLVIRKGAEFVEGVENDNRPRHHSIEWLKRFTAIMRAKLRRMKARRS